MITDIIKILDGIGIYTNSDVDIYTKLVDLINDSMQFITFIVELEQFFDVEIPDLYLQPDALITLGDVCDLIRELDQTFGKE